jgi:dipeptidyl aminopeptidase/acylaminoacyl peptidase
MPPGKLLFARADTLLAAPFDLDSLEVTGGPVAILGGLRTENSWAPGGFSYTRDGTLGYVPGGMVGAKRRIAIADRSGKVEPWSEERRSFETWPVLSRDGRRVAVVITNPNAIYEIWISDRDRPALRRLVAAADADCYAPVWSPEADRIAYGRVAKNDLDGIYLQAADGAAPPRRIFRPASPADQYLPWQWTPDGSGIVMIRQSAGKADVVLLPVPKGTGETAQAKPLLASAFNEVDPAISPDGRWLAYASDESGRFEVYVVPFRADGAAGAATPVSREGGARPRWAADGRTLYYASDKNVLMSVAVPDRSAAAFAAPAPVLDLEPLRISAPRAAFDVLPDGRLVIIQKGEEEDELRRFNLVLNWSAELAKRMPAAR